MYQLELEFKEQWIIHDVELIYTRKSPATTLVTNSTEVANVCREIIPENQCGLKEFFAIALFNRANRVLHRSLISVGGLNSTVCEVKNIVQIALLSNAAALVLCHNHPSGALKPSSADIHLTNRVAEICNLLDLVLLDHIILSPFNNEYYSFADNGDLP